jgi:hypothetical protein
MAQAEASWRELQARGVAIGNPRMDLVKWFSGTFDHRSNAKISCVSCGEEVERALKIVRGTPLVFVFLACGCGCVVHFQNDPAPQSATDWQAIVRRLRRDNCDCLMLNLNPDDEATQGLN